LDDVKHWKAYVAFALIVMALVVVVYYRYEHDHGLEARIESNTQKIEELTDEVHQTNQELAELIEILRDRSD
jgi:Tfp pilus assembly protein PilO